MNVYDTFLACLSAPCLVLTGFIGAYGTSEYHLNAQQLEGVLAESAIARLDSAGLDWAKVRMQGQTAVVSGEAPSPAAATAALASVATAAGRGGWLYGGITAVEGQFTYTDSERVSSEAPYIWRAIKTASGELTLIGAVPDQSSQASLFEAAADQSIGTVQDRTSLIAGSPAEDWSQIAEFGLEKLALLDSGEARLQDMELRLSGVALQDAARIQAIAEVSDLQAPWSGLAVVAGPSQWRAQHVADTLILSGTCENATQCAEIVSLAEQYYDGEVSDQMRTQETEYAPWIQGVQAGLPHFAQFKSGQMRFDPDSEGFAFEGEATSSQLQFLSADMAERVEVYPVSFEVDRQTIEVEELIGVVPDDNPLISCQRAFDLVLGANQVVFETGSAEISRSSGLTLDKIMAVSSLCEQSLRFEIIGHTDSDGDTAANLELSRARAQAVANYMTQAGFDMTRLIVTGKGATESIASNAEAEGRASNRRIEFSVQEWSE